MERETDSMECADQEEAGQQEAPGVEQDGDREDECDEGAPPTPEETAAVHRLTKEFLSPGFFPAGRAATDSGVDGVAFSKTIAMIRQLSVTMLSEWGALAADSAAQGIGLTLLRARQVDPSCHGHPEMLLRYIFGAIRMRRRMLNRELRRTNRHIDIETMEQAEEGTAYREELVFLQGDESAGGDLETRERAAVFRRAIADLPLKQRRVITLLLIDGLSYEQTAAEVRVTVRSIKRTAGLAATTLETTMTAYNRGLL